jgi:hypothetical protein
LKTRYKNEFDCRAGESFGCCENVIVDGEGSSHRPFAVFDYGASDV